MLAQARTIRTCRGSVTLNGSNFFLFEINPISFPELNDGSEYEIEINQKSIIFVFSYSQPIASMSESETEKLVTNRRQRKMLNEDIWLPLQEVGELSQTGDRVSKYM
jgi:hypothetical protein